MTIRTLVGRVTARGQRALVVAPCVLAIALGLGALPRAAHAAPSACATSGVTVTCTYTFTGQPQPFTVPAGVTTLQIATYGAPGGPDGGRGAVVIAPLSVTPLQPLYVVVGGNPSYDDDELFHIGPTIGGFNGGGSARLYANGGSGGGGASDIRTNSTDLSSRLIVAAGGGGAGSYGNCQDQEVDPVHGSGNGGNAGSPGHDAPPCQDQLGGGGGGAGTQSAGGAVGISYYQQSEAGTLGKGGNGTASNGSGGGGGGLYGGGAGGDGAIRSGIKAAGSGGGGGGSNLVPAGGVADIDPVGIPQVIITYEDTSAPTTNPSQSPAINSAGWNNGDVVVTWNWSDSGSGIDTSKCPATSASSGEGTVELKTSCTDLASNQASASYTVKVDKTVPTISAAATSAPNANGWYNAPVAVHFNCADALSGIPQGACPPTRCF